MKIEVKHHCFFLIKSLEGKEEKAFEILKEGVEIVKKYSKYWVSGGTALGLIRQGSFIPHDTDIDIEIIDNGNCEKIISGLIEEGFILIRTQKLNGYQQIAFLKEEVIFDIYVYNKEGENYVNFNEKGKWILPSYLIETLEEHEFSGTAYLFPSPVKEYLGVRYKNWEIPTSSNGDWTEQANNLMHYGVVVA